MRQLIEEAFSDELGANRDLHLALLDAGRDPLVEPVLRRVTARRLGHLRACYRALGFDARTARLGALQAYATYLGTLRLRRDLPEYAPRGRLDAAYRGHLTTTLMPD